MGKWLYPLVCLMGCLLSVSLDAMHSEEALKRLMEGNERYIKDQLIHPDRTSERREAIEAKQKPFAIILGCSDSRVAPEIVFDQGVGDLFVVRVAGNVVGTIELESIQYAAEYLGSSLILVLGHQNCGAVDAVYQGKTQDIGDIAALIEPAIRECKKKEDPSLESCIKANVSLVVSQLKKYPVLKGMIEKKQIKIVGGYYSLSNGRVDLIPTLEGNI